MFYAKLLQKTLFDHAVPVLSQKSAIFGMFTVVDTRQIAQVLRFNGFPHSFQKFSWPYLNSTSKFSPETYVFHNIRDNFFSLKIFQF